MSRGGRKKTPQLPVSQKEALVRQREVSETNDGKGRSNLSMVAQIGKSKIEIERPTQNIGDSRVVTRQMEPTERDSVREGAKWTIHRPQLSRSM